jgi:hypothetical protein
METIPAPPPSRPCVAPQALWALWLAGVPGVSLGQVQEAVRSVNR